MTTFLVIGGAGVVLLVLALVLGDLLDGAMEGPDLGGMLDSDIFSTAGIAGLVGGFGFGGAIALSLVDITWLAVIVGLAVGVLLGMGAGWLTRRLKVEDPADQMSTQHLVGRPANVVSPVPDDGYGQIRLSYGGHRVTLNARSVVPIESGARVWVTQVLSPTAVEVSPIEPFALDPGPGEIDPAAR